jgi:hypothetical protein
MEPITSELLKQIENKYKEHIPTLFNAIEYVYKSKCRIGAPLFLSDVELCQMILDVGGSTRSAVSALLYLNKDYLSEVEISGRFGEDVSDIIIDLMTFYEDSLRVNDKYIDGVSLIASAICLQELRQSQEDDEDEWSLDKLMCYGNLYEEFLESNVPLHWVQEMKELLDILESKLEEVKVKIEV